MESEKHLLVDGSNILHAWPDLRALLRRDRGAARSRLSLALAGLHDAEHLRVSLVFDGRGPELVVERPSGQAGFTHLYSPSGMTADDIIEQIVGNSRNPGECLVATDDRAERQTIEALGAAGLSAADLAAWVERSGARQHARLRDRGRANEKEWRRRAP
jgi:predicted RNA-binding protein with PIN domain